MIDIKKKKLKKINKPYSWIHGICLNYIFIFFKRKVDQTNKHAHQNEKKEKRREEIRK